LQFLKFMKSDTALHICIRVKKLIAYLFKINCEDFKFDKNKI